MNAQEFMRLPVTHCRVELWRGVVHERPFLDAASGSAVSRLMAQAYCPHLYNDSVTALSGGTGFQIERDPDTVIAPNGAFYVGGRLGKVDEDVYLTLAPDIVVEACLPDMQEEELARRAGWWLRFGAKVVWVLDADGQTLTACVVGKEAITFRIEDTFNGGDVLPGITIPIRRLFGRQGNAALR